MNHYYNQCRECAKEGITKPQLIVNKTHMLCIKHNRKRLDKQTGIKKIRKQIVKKRFSDKFNYAQEWGFTKEIDMFQYIWETRPHVSEISGRPINYFSPSNFAHVLAKGLNKYPHFRFYPGNVLLLHPEEHNIYDSGTKEQAERYKKEWMMFDIDKIYKLAEELKMAYKEMFG